MAQQDQSWPRQGLLRHISLLKLAVALSLRQLPIILLVPSKMLQSKLQMMMPPLLKATLQQPMPSNMLRSRWLEKPPLSRLQIGLLMPS